MLEIHKNFQPLIVIYQNKLNLKQQLESKQERDCRIG